MSDSDYLAQRPEGVVISVKLQPRASREEISSVAGGELKIKVTAPPVDSAANEALVELLADRLGCGKGRVILLRGQTSRHKVVLISGATIAEVRRGLEAR